MPASYHMVFRPIPEGAVSTTHHDILVFLPLYVKRQLFLRKPQYCPISYTYKGLSNVTALCYMQCMYEWLPVSLVYL